MLPECKGYTSSVILIRNHLHSLNSTIFAILYLLINAIIFCLDFHSFLLGSSFLQLINLRGELAVWPWFLFPLSLQQEESDVGLPGGNGQVVTLGLGLLFTAIAAAYVTRLAKVMTILLSRWLIVMHVIANL